MSKFLVVLVGVLMGVVAAMIVQPLGPASMVLAGFGCAIVFGLISHVLIEVIVGSGSN